MTGSSPEAGLGAILTAVLLQAACGGTVVLPPEVAVTTGPGLEYAWQEGDTWRFLAWAVLDADRGEGHETLALTAGFAPGVPPEPGAIVRLPLDPSLAGALESRLAAARLVRQATRMREEGRAGEVPGLLLQAIERDAGWSVPRFDLALLVLEEGLVDSARALLEPVATRPRAALLLGVMDWEGCDLEGAVRHLEEAVAGVDPPPEALAAAAIAQMAAGNRYRASRLWLELLQDPDAPSELRLMGLHYCMMLEER